MCVSSFFSFFSRFFFKERVSFDLHLMSISRWAATCLRVKDARLSAQFYEKNFNFVAVPALEDEHHVDVYLCVPLDGGVPTSIAGYHGVWLKLRQVKSAAPDVKVGRGGEGQGRGSKRVL